MNGRWRKAALAVAGAIAFAPCAIPQSYTMSAKPGVVNYIEGKALLDGNPLSENANRSTFMQPNDTLSTEAGKVEVLLTPGVFLRMGDNSEVRMISPSLTETQIEVTRGEVMIEAAGLIKENHISVIDHGGSVMIEKNGLYRFEGDAPPSVAVLEGKAQVYVGHNKTEVGKGHEVVFSDNLKAEKFDSKKEDELYAWSNVRSEYDAAATYQAARSLNASAFNGSGALDYGSNGWYGPGWYWANGFNSWAWLPGTGSFYSPFGWGFYSPLTVGAAPVVIAPVYRGGTIVNGHWTGTPQRGVVPISPKNPPALGVVANNPWANRAARAQTGQTFAGSGFSRGVVNGNNRVLNSPARQSSFANRPSAPAAAPAPHFSAPASVPHASGGGFSHAAGAPSHR